MRILLVEDDALLGDSIRAAIAGDGYAIDWLQDGRLAHAAIRNGAYDLVILDIRLPGQSGLQILRGVRGEGLEVPVLLLTACDAVSDKVAGLDAGADDYLTKPFELDELFARVRSLLRRSGSRAPLLRAGELEMDPAARRVSFGGDEITDLTAKEFAVLELLLRNRGRFVTKSRLQEGSSNWDEQVESNTVEVYISRLRRRFGHDSIETLRGVGYRIR